LLKSDSTHPAPEPLELELADAVSQAPSLPARAVKLALKILPLVLLVAAIFVLRREFKGLSWDAVVSTMIGWGYGPVAAAIGLSIVSFLLMGVVEWLGLRWVGARLPWGVALAGSFLSSAIAHAVGANLLVSGAIRARLYDRYGVNLRQVAGATLFGGMSFAVGIGALGGAGLLIASPAELAATAIPVQLGRTAGALMVSGALGWVALCAVRRRPITAFGRSLTLPSPRAALMQLAVGLVDNGTAAAIVWVLLPHGSASYESFVGAYAVSCVGGLLSGVPGGAGVFESAISALLPTISTAGLAAAFLGYRLFYYVLPLVIATAILMADALVRRRGDKA